jgi:hypothetical protein
MTKTETRILELFRTLAPNEQRALVEKLSEATQPQSFFNQMTSDQRAKFDEGLAQAEAGDVTPAADVFDRLAKRFGFSKG